VKLRTIADLLAFVDEGGRPEYLMSWGHRATGKGYLSQWWPAPFTEDGLTYPSAEHFMMAGKASLFGDEQTAARIRAITDPAKAKALGREVRGFDEQRWTAERLRIVVTGNLAKFGQHPDLREYLRGTADKVLVEASPEDRVWGIDPRTWRGLNLLGFALMEVRHRLSECDEFPDSAPS
jgi:ribA/ribD-fused uncharacterized protein